MRRNYRPAFTLAELLIALAILGVIATFTIPKVLQSQQDSRFKSVAKETAAMVSGAYQAYKLNNTVPSTMTMLNLTPFMNYVRVETVALVDHSYTNTSASCASPGFCLVLHNGAVVRFRENLSFGNTASTNVIGFLVDPDGIYSNTTNGPGKSVDFHLYYTGRLTTRQNIDPTTANSDGALPPAAGVDPPWFSWD